MEKEGNATLMARTPVQDRLLAECPTSFLIPSGESVGLPAGQMGNSEVGHLNLGAGRIVYQDLTRISKAVADGTFFDVPAFTAVAEHVRQRGTRLHLMGLVSDGGVHSHLDHLLALLKVARRHELGEVLIHCFTDGRDTSPTGGAEYLATVAQAAAQSGIGRIASIVGRYYAMDRDRRWERVVQAYNLLAKGEGVRRDDPVAALRQWYAEGKTDEFIPPTAVVPVGIDPASQRIADGDGVIFFNFRSDRARQITTALTAPEFTAFERGPRLGLHYVCMTEYDKTFALPIAFPPQSMQNLFCHEVERAGLAQLRIAETEKYPHVTYFFNGGVEEPVRGEERSLIPSPKVATYDLKPEMSALELTADFLSRLESRRYDVVICNYANPDMVGHTGSIPATVKAVETVDECVGRVLATLAQAGGVALVTADHGNAEKMLDEEGKPFTAHTSNPVHLFYVGADRGRHALRDGILADVAPTMLALLGLPQPVEMTGRNLLAPR
jgi:2,3-bisphosphoglycerate-independent phosphoglycerate mutase